MPTIAEQLTQLESDREDLVDNLETKGITGLTGDETFTELVPEVLNISGGGGSGLDWSAIGYSGEPQSVVDGYNYAKSIYDNWVNPTSCYEKYKYNDNLKYMPLVDTSNSTSFTRMFMRCTKLENIPQLNVSNGTSFTEMFYMCSSLKEIPQLNTSNGTSLTNMFSNCELLIIVEPLNASNVINISGIFSNCLSLETLGGFTNLGQAYLTTQSANYSNYTLTLSPSTKITHDSLMNVINNLYDIATKGCNAQKLVLGSKNLAKLTAEEISTATNKGWSVS